jgi:hypothetical protein
MRIELSSEDIDTIRNALRRDARDIQHNMRRAYDPLRRDLDAIQVNLCRIACLLDDAFDASLLDDMRKR